MEALIKKFADAFVGVAVVAVSIDLQQFQVGHRVGTTIAAQVCHQQVDG
ncbi:MAG: hypothetical protein ABIR94_08270 [Rubrivivax sp.]